MKKFLSILTIGAFLASAPFALACQPGESCWNTTYKNNASSTDWSVSETKNFDFSKNRTGEEAGAWAAGSGEAEYSAYSGSKLGLNAAAGEENTGSDSMSNTHVFDSGTFSHASGIAHQESFGEAGAIAGGLGYKGVAKTQVGAQVHGEVFQWNEASESGHGDTGAFAANHSGAEYYGFANDAACDTGTFLWGSAAGVGLSGQAFTMGDSLVQVDPYGNHQSAYGRTGTFSFADVKGEDLSDTHVFGSGIVATSAGVGHYGNGAYSTGFSGFTYDGSGVGFGVAEHTTYATKYSDCTTNSARAGSSGSAFSFVAGGSNPNNGDQVPR